MSMTRRSQAFGSLKCRLALLAEQKYYVRVVHTVVQAHTEVKLLQSVVKHVLVKNELDKLLRL